LGLAAFQRISQDINDDPDLNDQIGVCYYNVEPIDSSDGEIASAMERFGADLLVYGNASPRGDAFVFSPMFAVDGRVKDKTAEDLTSSAKLGTPLVIDDRWAQSDAAEAVGRRAAALQAFAMGITALRKESFPKAMHYFHQAILLNEHYGVDVGNPTEPGTEVFQLYMGTAYKLRAVKYAENNGTDSASAMSDIESAKGWYEKAQRRDYPRPLVGLGLISYEQYRQSRSTDRLKESEMYLEKAEEINRHIADSGEELPYGATIVRLKTHVYLGTVYMATMYANQIPLAGALTEEEIGVLDKSVAYFRDVLTYRGVTVDGQDTRILVGYAYRGVALSADLCGAYALASKLYRKALEYASDDQEVGPYAKARISTLGGRPDSDRQQCAFLAGAGNW
jgi:tetratricopeptide (TPR) repeat protein